MSVTEVLSSLLGASFVVGFFAGCWVSNRWIDHRWYCGRRHRASHQCVPKPEHVERWREREERLDRAEELEGEAERLRELH